MYVRLTHIASRSVVFHLCQRYLLGPIIRPKALGRFEIVFDSLPDKFANFVRADAVLRQPLDKRAHEELDFVRALRRPGQLRPQVREGR